MSWRLIIDIKPRSASENMSIDSALQQLCKGPCLRFYTWFPPAVSIGRFQSLSDEVDLDFCKKNKIDFIRRVTGGGAVFHEHEITYSITIPEDNDFFPSDLHESYKAICSSIMGGFKKIGLNPEYAPINDILVNKKKISGCAQTRKGGIILHHGTILLDVDVEKMFNILKVPDEKIRDKLISDVKKRVTGIRAELGKQMEPQELIPSFVESFADSLDIEFDESIVSDDELALAKQIRLEVYDNDDWLFER